MQRQNQEGTGFRLDQAPEQRETRSYGNSYEAFCGEKWPELLFRRLGADRAPPRPVREEEHRSGKAADDNELQQVLLTRNWIHLEFL